MEDGHGGDAYGGRGPEVVGVTWMLMVVVTIIVLLRLFVRLFLLHPARSYEDVWASVWAVLAWLCGIVGNSFLSVGAHYGFGNRTSVVIARGNLRHALLYTMIWASFGILTIVLAKFSVVAFLIEAQGNMGKFQKWGLIFLVATSLCMTIVDEFLLWFQCVPGSGFWNWEAPNKCRLWGVNYDYTIFSASWSAFADLVLTLYPVYFIYGLQISIRKKLGLGFVLALGLFSCVCACMRAYELHILHHSTDPTFDAVPLVCWHVAESSIILIATGVLPLWPLIKISFKPPLPEEPIRLKSISQPSVEDDQELEQDHSNRTSASTNTMLTDATTVRNSMAGPEIEGAIAVKREITIDSQRRKHFHGPRPRASSRTWASFDNSKRNLARWSSGRTIRTPSLARAQENLP